VVIIFIYHSVITFPVFFITHSLKSFATTYFLPPIHILNIYHHTTKNHHPLSAFFAYTANRQFTTSLHNAIDLITAYDSS